MASGSKGRYHIIPKEWLAIEATVSYMVFRDFFVGAIIDWNRTRAVTLSKTMQEDDYFNFFGPDVNNLGLGQR